MSSGGCSSSAHKQYVEESEEEEEQKLLTLKARQYCSQPPITTNNQIPTNSSIDKQEMMANASEIIHMPPQYQRFKSLLDLPHAATAIIRHSPSTTRTLVRSVTGQCYIELDAQNSNNTASNRQDTSLQSDSTSTWPV